MNPVSTSENTLSRPPSYGEKAVGLTFEQCRQAMKLALEWLREGYLSRVEQSPAVTSNKTIYTVYVNAHVPDIPGGEFVSFEAQTDLKWFDAIKWVS